MCQFSQECNRLDCSHLEDKKKEKNLLPKEVVKWLLLKHTTQPNN